jgi:hypothetical protein
MHALSRIHFCMVYTIFFDMESVLLVNFLPSENYHASVHVAF